MRPNLFYSREISQALLRGSSFSTVRACVATLVFVLLAINCGTPPQGQYPVPETAVKAAEKNQTQQSTQNQASSLPGSATVRLAEQPYLRNAFSEPAPASRTGLDDFFAMTRGKVQHAAIVSGASFDVLKAFIAEGWAPIVMIQFQGRTPEILPVSDYNDQLSEVSLQNPTNLNKRRLTYKAFEAAWGKDPRKKVVLITPQRLTETDLESVLGNYLPAEAFQEVSIRSR
ncbi:MAG: hypothetical protein OXI63_24625 [Candidatus Poribacteria bacterium]|nr:hypothetical protein [Candidatus Poribacteria bacterium]